MEALKASVSKGEGASGGKTVKGRKSAGGLKKAVGEG
jgi:hypothetical protein